MELRRQCIIHELSIKGIETCTRGKKLLRTMTLSELETEYSRYKDRDFINEKVGDDIAQQSNFSGTFNQGTRVKVHP
ncbi:hypothetical protein IHV10_22210 [Fictibacillus sp. 5RED26]|uniref:hypothetical protein n=1 Tax=Fictibacillus sp. 5RED26 TaxID=2745876 RepID=UPI0018CEDC87|nr:hypothetical protein [Fictibacillus sp. 5RED26]MBH0159087.1 hypothetical protein [Fictibacillus sp. 5RED26]